jgi:hypothetical protein
LDALQYASGLQLHRVELDGKILKDDNKLVASRMRILNSYNVSLRHILCWAVEYVGLYHYWFRPADTRLERIREAVFLVDLSMFQNEVEAALDLTYVPELRALLNRILHSSSLPQPGEASHSATESVARYAVEHFPFLPTTTLKRAPEFNCDIDKRAVEVFTDTPSRFIPNG